MDALYSRELSCLDALYECLLRERECLVLFRTEEILENNARKEALFEDLRRASRGRRFQIADAEYGSTEQGKLYSEKRERLRTLCSQNQQFIERSLKRHGALIANLRKLVAGPGVYSSAGTSQERSTEGRVIAGKY